MKYLDEIADSHSPVMLYAYPLDSEPARERIMNLSSLRFALLITRGDGVMGFGGMGWRPSDK